MQLLERCEVTVETSPADILCICSVSSDISEPGLASVTNHPSRFNNLIRGKICQVTLVYYLESSLLHLPTAQRWPLLDFKYGHSITQHHNSFHSNNTFVIVYNRTHSHDQNVYLSPIATLSSRVVLML